MLIASSFFCIYYKLEREIDIDNFFLEKENFNLKNFSR